MINYQGDKKSFFMSNLFKFIDETFRKNMTTVVRVSGGQQRNFISLYNIELIAENSAKLGSLWGDGVFFERHNVGNVVFKGLHRDTKNKISKKSYLHQG